MKLKAFKKSHNTVNKLVFRTKNGSIGYILDAYSCSVTGRFITEATNTAG